MKEKHDIVIDHVSRIVYAEARGEPYEGKLAIAWVIKNRYNHSDKIYGETIGEISTKKNQFHQWRKPIYNESSWRESIKAAEKVFYEDSKDLINGATHFLSEDSNPDWSQNINPSVTIGSLRFFNNIDKLIY